MGRRTQPLDVAQCRNIRIDFPHDSDSRQLVVKTFLSDWVEEVVISAENNDEGNNPHYHIVGRFKYSTYAINKLLIDTFRVRADAFYNKAPQEAKGGYAGACRYACKGLDCVYQKTLDYQTLHKQYWEINRELRCKKKEQLSVRDTILEKFKGKVGVENREIVTAIIEEYKKRRARISSEPILSLARLVLAMGNVRWQQAYTNFLCEKL